MLIRRAILSLTTSRGAHLCIKSTCKQCISRLASIGIRALSTKLARQDNSKEVDISRLAKPVEKEMEFQRRLIREEKLTIERVMEDYAKLLRDNNITVEADSEESVKLTIPRDGFKYVLKFEPSEVAQAVNSSINPKEDGKEASEEQDEDDEEEEEEDDDMEDMDGEYDGEKMPFNLTVEMHRDGSAKSLSVEAEVTPSYENEGYDLYVMDVSIQKEKVSYSGPSYDTLDDEIREQFDQLINKNFRKIVPFIADYARAKEAKLYADWLQDVKEIVTTSNSSK